MEKRQRIRKLIVRRKDDFITALEKNWRDWLLKPVTNIFSLLGIRANFLTIIGFLLIAAAVFAYFLGISFKWQLAILILAGLSDAIDGPTARNNDDITILGTWMDHSRDGLLVGWVSFLIYKYQLLSLETILILWALQLILVWILLKDFLIRYLQVMTPDRQQMLLDDFSLDNLQASIIGRIQFFSWCVSYLCLLLFIVFPISGLLIAGHILIVLTIIFAALNILEAYQKSI